MNNQAVYIDATTPEGQHLQKRLSDAKTIEAIDHLLAKIQTLEEAVSQLTTIMQQGPGLVSIAADSVDEVYRQSAEKGVNIEERLVNALHLAEKITEPERFEKLERLIQLSDQFPGLMSMAADSIDEVYRKNAERGVYIEERLSSVLALTEKITAPEKMEQLGGLLKLSDQLPGLIAMFVDAIDEEVAKASAAGVDLKTLQELGQKLSTAVVESNQMPIQKMGPFGLFRALRDPDRQKAVGFLMNLAKALGQKL